MPYKSDAQRKFMHANHPAIARRWDSEMRMSKPMLDRTKKANRLGNAADLENDDDDVVIGKNNAVGFKKKTGGLQGVEFGGTQEGKLGSTTKPKLKVAKGSSPRTKPQLPGIRPTGGDDEDDPKRAALLRRLRARRARA